MSWGLLGAGWMILIGVRARNGAGAVVRSLIGIGLVAAAIAMHGR